MSVYKPRHRDECLEDGEGRRIALVPHFILAAHAPMLSLRNVQGPVAFYRGVRIAEPVTVAGVNVSDYVPVEGDSYRATKLDFDCRHAVTKDERELPPGSLLLRRFDDIFGTGRSEGEWYALTPDQQVFQNMRRVRSCEGRLIEEVSMADMDFTDQFRCVSSKAWHCNRVQQQAHIDDIAIMEETGMFRLKLALRY